MCHSLRNSVRVLAVVAGLALVAIASDAKAQGPYYPYPPSPYNIPVYGSVDPWGNSRIVYLSRLTPGASVPMPGSTRYYFNGTTWVRSWVGMDGLPHSNVTSYNPATGTTTTEYRCVRPRH